MKLEATTEKEMREAKAPWPKTIQELNEYMQSCFDAVAWPEKEDGTFEHSTKDSGDAYGRAVYAISLSATAAFYYASHIVGASGFQASMADIDLLRRTRHMEGPFSIVDVSKMLYPQYDIVGDLNKYIHDEETQKWLKDQAKKKISENPDAHPDVVAHWKKLAGEQ